MSELTRNEIFDLLNRPGPLWLSSVDLSGANLSEADLSGANLIVTNLSGADLSGANLRVANLSETTMPDGTKHK